MNSYHQVGGSLNVTDPSYVTRKADNELYQALLRGEFCYVFNCRQMGKSSLRVRVKNRLEHQGAACVALDMTNIGSQRISALQWYKSIASELWRGFNLMGKIKFKAWWESQQGLSPIQQLSRFISDIILSEIKAEQIFIFIDEIDSVISLDFSTDDFFALIRYFYNQRAENTEFKRLSFALFGVATPSDLIRDPNRTPFNIGTAIELRGFTLEEAMPLIDGFQSGFENSSAILEEILNWTGGQPFLTQKLCRLVVQHCQESNDCLLPGTEGLWVKKLVTEKVIDNWEAQDEPEHLKTIRDRLLRNEQQASRLLSLGTQILRYGAIPVDDSAEQRYLLLSNLVIKQNSQLNYRNLIYQQIFNLDWIRQQQSRLHPFSKEVEFWLASDCRDQSRLLRGKALQEAQAWANTHNISQSEYQFLTASQELEVKQALETTRLQEVETRLVAEKQNSEQQKILIAALSVALGLATGLGLLAQRQSYRAAQSEQKTVATVIDSLATSSEALYVSEQRLEALTQAIKAKVELQKLDWTEPSLTTKVERYLRRATYGIQEVNRLSGHTGPIWEIDFSPDRQLILSASEDSTAKLWQLDGTLVTTYQGHTGGVWAVDFSQDQTKVITASWDRTLKLWDLDGKLLQTLKGHQDRVWEVTYNPDDTMIASASWDQTIKLWTADGELITTLTGHQDRVWGIDFSRDGKILASASWDKTIKLWDVEQSIKLNQPVIIATLKGHQEEVNNVDFSADSQDLVSASNDGTLILWDVSNPQQPQFKKTLVGHQDRVNSVAYNKQTGEIISTSDDKTIKIWSPEGTLITTFKGHRDRIVGLGVRTDGEMIASGGYDKTIRLWQPRNNLLTTLEGHNAGVWHVAFSPDGKLIASGSRDSQIKLWTAEGEFVTTLTGHRNRVHDVVFHPSQQVLASGSDDNTVKIWNLQGELLQTLKGHNASVFTVAFSPDGNYLASAGEDHEVKIWNLQGELIKSIIFHQGAIIELAFSPDSKTLATASRDKTVKLWDWTDDSPREHIITLKGHQNVVYSVTPSPNGQVWATASWDGTIKLWNQQGQPLATFRGHQGEVNQIRFSPNGQTIASASADRTIKLWNLEGKELFTLERHTAKVWSVGFSPDGKTLVSASDDRHIILWDLERILKLDYFAAACNWIKDYLQTNPNVNQSDRNLCHDH
ncbi:MAG: AAA-like domain-containing protein [Cyanobacteria bacterium P01_E01_bin.35]